MSIYTLGVPKYHWTFLERFELFSLLYGISKIPQYFIHFTGMQNPDLLICALRFRETQRIICFVSLWIIRSSNTEKFQETLPQCLLCVQTSNTPRYNITFQQIRNFCVCSTFSPKGKQKQTQLQQNWHFTQMSKFIASRAPSTNDRPTNQLSHSLASTIKAQNTNRERESTKQTDEKVRRDLRKSNENTSTKRNNLP